MGSNTGSPEDCHPRCHVISELSGGRENNMPITQKTVLEKLLELYREKKRAAHIADLKEAFNVVEKRDVVRPRGWRKTDKIEYALRELFKKGKLSRSEKQIFDGSCPNASVMDQMRDDVTSLRTLEIRVSIIESISLTPSPVITTPSSNEFFRDISVRFALPMYAFAESTVRTFA